MRLSRPTVACPTPTRGRGHATAPWVITGTLSQARDEIAEQIIQHGGKISGSVSKKTSFVLAGEEAGSKLEKARKLGLRIVDEAEFRRMLETLRSARHGS